MDFGNVSKVTKIGTQGGFYSWRVSKYTVSYSVNGGYFENQRRVSSKFHFVVEKQETDTVNGN